MGLLFAIAGLILLLAGSGWFTGAATVGVILLVVGGIGIAIQILIGLAAAKAVSKTRRDFPRRF